MRMSPFVDQVSTRHRPRGGMLSLCTEPGCTTLTLGGTCVAHDPPVKLVFTRGRPFTPAGEGDAAIEQASPLRAPVV